MNFAKFVKIEQRDIRVNIIDKLKQKRKKKNTIISQGFAKKHIKSDEEYVN
jgi:hypothetical protein